jgi:hypothetical protein
VFDARAGGSVRSWIDEQTDHPGIDQGLEKTHASLVSAVAAGQRTAESASAKASAWREQIATILKASND